MRGNIDSIGDMLRLTAEKHPDRTTLGHDGRLWRDGGLARGDDPLGGGGARIADPCVSMFNIPAS